VLRDLAEDAVAALTRLVDVAGLQREAQALGGCVRLVNRQVAPPHAAIIPKVVIGVLLVNSKRELGFAFHAFLCLGIGLNMRFFVEERRFLGRGCAEFQPFIQRTQGNLLMLHQVSFFNQSSDTRTYVFT